MIKKKFAKWILQFDKKMYIDIMLFDIRSILNLKIEKDLYETKFRFNCSYKT